MSKTETNDERIKAAYICPNIVCIAVESSLCAGSPFNIGHDPALPGGPIEEDEDEVEEALMQYEVKSEKLYE